MGLLLFIIYLNDLGTCFKLSGASICADDANITIESEDMAKLLNLPYWMTMNKFSSNPKVFGHRAPTS